MTHVAAEGTALFVNAENPRNAFLPFTGSTLQGRNVVTFKVAVLSLEECRKVAQRPALIVDETREAFAAL